MLVRMAEEGSLTILHRGLYRKHKKNILKTKLIENTDIRKAMAIHWREASDGQEHWLMHWGWLKSYQTCTQANMLAVFSLTTARYRRWWSHCPSLWSPEMPISFFARQHRKGALCSEISFSRTNNCQTDLIPFTYRIASVTFETLYYLCVYMVAQLHAH